MTYISYRNCLLYTIDYLIKIDFLDIAQLVIEYVDDGSNINLIEKLFYVSSYEFDLDWSHTGEI